MKKVDNIIINGKPALKFDEGGLSEFLDNLFICIDSLEKNSVSVSEKIGKDKEYLDGYSDACRAIKNTATTIKNMMGENN